MKKNRVLFLSACLSALPLFATACGGSPSTGNSNDALLPNPSSHVSDRQLQPVTTDPRVPPIPGLGGATQSAPSQAQPTPTTPAAQPPAAQPPAAQPPAAQPPAAQPPAASSAPSGPHAHRRCAWIGPGDAQGVATFVANADYFDAIHPDWFALQSDGVTLKPIAGADDATVISTAQAHHVLLVPMLASVEDAAYVRLVISDAAHRTAHVQAVVALVTSHHYDGIDLDYEHLWSASDRPGMTALLTELAQALHAQGKLLSIALPPLVDSNPNSAWDITALTGVVDVMHIMGYDFHTVGTHEGPVSPLGWIDAVAAHVAATGHPEKFIMGLPNYGVTASWFANSKDAAATCGPGYATTTDHMATCGFGNYNAGRAPHCTTSHGELYFDDLASLEEKVAVAQKHKLAGITHWTLGSEPDGFFSMVRKYF